MIRLFKQFILRQLAKEKLRTFVTVLGIALGVAVVVAIQMTNAGSLRGFEKALETVSGRTSLEIVGSGAGLDERRLRELTWLREYGRMSPIIEGDAEIETGPELIETLRALGVDVLRDRSFRDYRILEFAEQRREPRPEEFLELLLDSRSIILTERFAGRHSLEVGDEVRMTFSDRRETFRIRGLLKNEGPARAMDGNFALMDIAAAQMAFNRFGRIDRLELLIEDRSTIDKAEQEIGSRLPEGLRVQRPARRGSQVEKMLEAFHFNLTALSYIALLVGLFMIYNTISISVITRREETGTLRAIGVTGKQVLGLFLTEAVTLAVIGCALGLLFGRLLAFAAVKLTSTTVNALYIATAAEPPPLELKHALIAFGIGLPLSLIAAAIPALEASRVSPVSAMRGNDRLETRFRLRMRYLAIPALLGLLAWWFSRQGPVNGLPAFGYAAAVSIVFGAAFLAPAVLYALGKLGDKPLFRIFRIEGRLANSNLAGAIPRISISVAALAVSLSMMVAIAVMIGSFRETVIYWVEQTLKADLYLRPAARNNVADDIVFSPEAERIVRAHPMVAAADRFRNFDIAYGGGLVTLGTGEFEKQLEHGNLIFKAPSDGRAAMRAAIGRNAVVVSESFAIRHGKSVGDSIRLETPKGGADFRINAVYYDYSSDRGIIVMDRGTFRKYFGEPGTTSLSVYLKPGADADRVRDDLNRQFGSRFRILIYTNQSIRREVLRIFDSTFSITYALEVIAIFVAILGVASTLLTLILERSREIKILRLLGADRRQVRKMVVIEAGLMGGVSQSIGLVIGLLLSLVLIYVINVQSFGWTIRFHLPVGFLIQSSILILLTTALSGLYPARRASQLRIAEQLEEE
ncbi:MAG: ABC transporter permease [Acidobacteriota bacterium]|nr:MAG: ABC transporter permease [Acidobacteriota bacterium]